MKFVVVDAFSDVAFAGNPAAVVELQQGHGLPDSFLQRFAREMALSETAYIVRLGPCRYTLRWFTPTVEVDLCGHATLAAAHSLFEADATGRLSTIVFETKSGDLTAVKVGTDNEIELTFPEETVRPAQLPEGLAEACGLNPAAVTAFGKNRMDWVVVVAGGADAVKAITPNQAALGNFPARLVLVTSLANGNDRQRGVDFVSRAFGPTVGVPEDPVTGSAHCGLAPYWSEQLGKAVVRGFQCSVRGGEVLCTTGGGQVRLRGNAVTVTRGELVPPIDSLLSRL